MTFPFGRVLAGPVEESGRCLAHGPDFGLGSKSFAPGEVFARHRHDASEELFVGVHGVLTVTVGDATHELAPGDKIGIRRGVPHGIVNRTDARAEIAFVRIPYLPDDVVWV